MIHIYNIHIHFIIYILYIYIYFFSFQTQHEITLEEGSFIYTHIDTLKSRHCLCVLTVGLSPTKSMSTKNPKLGKTDRQLQIRFKVQLHMYFFVPYLFLDIYLMCLIQNTCANIGYATCVWFAFGIFLMCSNCGLLTN